MKTYPPTMLGSIEAVADTAIMAGVHIIILDKAQQVGGIQWATRMDSHPMHRHMLWPKKQVSLGETVLFVIHLYRDVSVILIHD